MVVAYTFDASTQEVEAGLSSRQAWFIEQVPVQSELLRKTVMKNKPKIEEKKEMKEERKKRRKESKMQE